MAPSQPPQPPNHGSGLPENVAQELATYVRLNLQRNLVSQVANLETRVNSENQSHKDNLQDVQSQISNVLQPTIDQLFPIADELENLYRQIDILDRLINKTIAPTISDLSTKLDRTEQLVRRQEKALNTLDRQATREGSSSGGSSSGRLEVWRGVEMGDVNARRRFVAGEWFDEGGRLRQPGSGGEVGDREE